MRILILFLASLAVLAQIPAPGQGGGSSSGGGGSAITSGRVAFGDGTGTPATDALFKWDNTNKYLQIGSVPATSPLQVNGQSTLIRGTISNTGLIDWFNGANVNGSLIQTEFGYPVTMSMVGDNAFGQIVTLFKTRSTDGVTSGPLQNNDGIGGVYFAADGGTENIMYPASIETYVDGTYSTGTDKVPGRIEFWTSPGGAGSPGDRALRLTVKRTGNVTLGASGDVGLYRNAANVLEVNNGTVGTYAAIKLARVLLTPVAVTSLATCNSGNAGSVQAVNDATAPAWGATVANGGAAYAQVTCNGTNWTVTGK